MNCLSDIKKVFGSPKTLNNYYLLSLIYYLFYLLSDFFNVFSRKSFLVIKL